MRILYDHQAFVMQRYGGISKYFASLSSGISKTRNITSDVKVLHTENGYLCPESNVLPIALGNQFLKKKSRMERWNRRYSQYLIQRDDFDVFHPTYYDPYFLDYIKKPYVITVHDMIHELFPEYFGSQDPTALNKRRVIGRADHVIAISESTKKDLQNLLGVAESKISVVYHGLFEPAVSSIDHTTKAFKTSGAYILFVGERSAYKNFYRFVTALANIFYKEHDINLICAGGGSFGYSELAFIERLKLKKRISQVTVNETELKDLYRKALFFCYPSLYEGFGLPILEAFASDCPVACSDTSCFIEVGGQAVSYFDPYSVEDMEAAFQNLIDNSDLRKSHISLGQRRLEVFPEEVCVAKTLKVYENSRTNSIFV